MKKDFLFQILGCSLRDYLIKHVMSTPILLLFHCATRPTLNIGRFTEARNSANKTVLHDVMKPIEQPVNS